METTTEEKGRGTMNGKPVFNVAAKTIINTKSGFQKKLLCDGLTFSLGDACVYRCAFCYVPSMFTKLPRLIGLREQHNLMHDEMVVRRENALDILKSELVHKNGKPKYGPEDHRVIYSSPAVDVAGNMTLVRETVEACKLILTHTHWHIRLLSKSNLLQKVAELLWEWAGGYDPERNVRARMIFGVSTGTLDNAIAAAFEQDTPLVSARIKSLHWLQDHGFRTFGMVCPSLPLPSAVDYCNFSKNIMEAIRVEKCEHVWAGVINVRGESMFKTVKALEADGFAKQAALLKHVSENQNAWDSYNVATFHAHASELATRNQTGKLRFLTYVRNETRAYWEECQAAGAVLL